MSVLIVELEKQGAQTMIDGDSYVGSWANDRPSGWGAFYWNNGNSYEGGVVDGVPQGQAIHYRWGDGAIFKCFDKAICFDNNQVRRQTLQVRAKGGRGFKK